jgi:BirA family biotin operon repressor/biotin-[acetyl-CoA-carboxylase] ligase
MNRPKTDLLDPDKIKEGLKTSRIGRKILVYNSTSSTNDVAAEYARNKQNDGLAVFAEEQTAGRGRAGNRWFSRRAESIICSIVIFENKLNAELLSLTFAVAVAEAIDGRGREKAKIKWPNDIMLNGKKVAGILLETKSLPISDRGEAVPALRPVGIPSTTLRTGLPTETNEGKMPSPHHKSKIYIVGIGINCHQKKESFPDELQNVATSVDAESHTISDRVLLARRLLSSIDNWLGVAEENDKDVIDRWRQLSVQLGRRISVLYNGNEFTGHCVGIDPEKGLILQLDTGGVRMFDAAHTSILKSST